MKFKIALSIIFLLLTCNACGDNDDGSQQADGDSDLQETSEAEENDTEKEPQDETPPVISELSIEGNENCPLAFALGFESDKEVFTTLHIKDASGNTRNVGPTLSASDSPVVPVLELLSDNSYKVYITATDAAGNATTSEPLTIKTPALPEELPQPDLIKSEPERTWSKIHLYSFYRWMPIIDMDWGYLIATNLKGEIVWYYKSTGFINEMRTLANGNIMFLDLEGATELDMLGNVIKQYRVEDMPIDIMHHSFDEMPNGNILVLATELRTIDGYIDDQGKERSYNVVGDVIAEFERSGEVVNTWSMFDYIDPHRIKEGFDGIFWTLVYSGQGITKDWTHGNQILYDASDDSMIISVCHQDWIMKIDHDSGELLWTLGVEGDFNLIGSQDWFYHQHAPQLLKNGNLIVYDNGDSRPLQEGVENFSRIVEYSFDFNDPTPPNALSVWEYRGEEEYYSPIAGAVAELPNGNLLITDSSIVSDRNASGMDLKNIRWSRLREITHEDEPEVLFEMEIKDKREEGDLVGYTIYRTVPLKSLYNENEWELK